MKLLLLQVPLVHLVHLVPLVLRVHLIKRDMKLPGETSLLSQKHPWVGPPLPAPTLDH